MKFALVLASVLAVVAVASSAVVKASSRSNLNSGYVAPGDRLLHRAYVYRQAMANTVQYEDVIYRGNATTRISAVQASEVGGTQWASAWILAGGLGRNNVTVRFQSYRGYGYYYLFDIWGR